MFMYMYVVMDCQSYVVILVTTHVYITVMQYSLSHPGVIQCHD